MSDYINHSGGCKGADLEWDRIGREMGFTFHKHYRPSDLKNLDAETRESLEYDVSRAAIALGRPTSEFPGKDLVRRNWFQATNASAIFAISRIIEPGETDKGFVNKTGKRIVSGGTAWACEMAHQQGKEVYVFDMNNNRWVKRDKDSYFVCDTPVLTKAYAGIGSRFITEQGLQAIRDVYTKTLKDGKV